MSLNKFITDMLNVNINQIEKISSINHSDNSISIIIKLVRNPDISCPYCKGKVKIHGYAPRKLIHSTLVNRKCIIIYHQRRYSCPVCDFTFHEQNPFINTKENVTYETKINVLNDLKSVTSTYSSVARRYNLSTTKVQSLFDKHVNIERKNLPEVLSIDEHYFPQSSYDSLYCCILMNFIDGTIIDVLPDRKKDYVSGYLSKIKNKTYDITTSSSELDNVKYVSIDLYQNYKDIANLYFPKSVVCADSFHVLKHLTEAFRKVRIRCRKSTEDKNLQYLLVKFKYIFNNCVYIDNKPKYNKMFNRYMNYRDMMDILFNNFPDLKIAYELKELYIHFNSTCTYAEAPKQLAGIILRFADSNIPEYNDFYDLLVNWSHEIINSFIIINNRRINNSYIESRNNLIERLFFNAYGFKSFKRTRNRILYCLNKDDTYKI